MEKNVVIWRKKPIKQLTKSLFISSGRNNHGCITVFHKGGGVKRRYRIIDFWRNLYDIPAFIIRIEYDAIRNVFLNLISYSNGLLTYILMSKGSKVNDCIYSRKVLNNEMNIGDSLFLKDIIVGSYINNIEKNINSGSIFVRAGGSKAQLLGQFNFNFVLVRLPSNEIRKFFNNSRATIGSLAFDIKRLFSDLKAGRSRWLNKRPIVRGVAMNPVDHPHGGNSGGGGRGSVSPWARYTKGYVTRNKRKNLIFVYKSRKILQKNEIINK